MKLCQVCSNCAAVADATCSQCGEASWAALASEVLVVEASVPCDGKAEAKAALAAEADEAPAKRQYHRKPGK